MPVNAVRAPDPTHSLDVVIVGAGPIGLQCGILAQRAGLSYLVLDKGPVAAAITRYPTFMSFFTTAPRLEIGGHPLITSTDKATRKEALDYYRRVVANEGLEVRTFSGVTGIRPTRHGADGVGAPFEVTVTATAPSGLTGRLRAAVVMLATGYFDNPNRLGVPGEDDGMVSHYYTEGHQYFGRPVVVIGGGSSAADAALDLYRAGADVTIVHRGPDFKKSLKYWIRPNLENRVREGAIRALFDTVVTSIAPGEVRVARRVDASGTAAGSAEHEAGAPESVIPADQVFALTGYYAPTDLLEGAGASFDPVTLAADLDPVTRESTVPGLFVVGSAGSGRRTSDVFIENGLVHVTHAMDAVVRRVAAAAAAGHLTLGQTR